MNRVFLLTWCVLLVACATNTSQESQLASSSNSSPSANSSSSSSPNQHSADQSNQDRSQQKIRQSKNLAERFLFHPLKHPQGDWKPQQLEFEDVEFKSVDGKKLHGWLVTPDSPSQVILYCHGNAGNVTHRAHRLRHFYDAGYAAMVFDYRGYGKSDGTPTTDGVVADAIAAIEFLENRFKVPASEIVVMGRSLGGAVAVQLAAKKQAKALVLESTFTSFHGIAKATMPGAAMLVSRNDLNSIATLKKFNGPVLISHAEEDEVIPFEQGEALYQAANHPKQFLRIPKGSHNDRSAAFYDPVLEKFLDSL